MEDVCGPLAGLRRPDHPRPCRAAGCALPLGSARLHGLVGLPVPVGCPQHSHVAVSCPSPLRGPLWDLIHVDLENVPFTSLLCSQPRSCPRLGGGSGLSPRGPGRAPNSGGGSGLSPRSPACRAAGSRRRVPPAAALRTRLLFSLRDAFTLNLFSCLLKRLPSFLLVEGSPSFTSCPGVLSGRLTA